VSGYKPAPYHSHVECPHCGRYMRIWLPVEEYSDNALVIFECVLCVATVTLGERWSDDFGTVPATPQTERSR
jgi:hypothetical protein